MRKNIIHIICVIWLCNMNFNSKASFAYVPFEKLLSEAEFIVTGVIIDKQYVKKESMMNGYERSPVTDEWVVKSSTKYMAQFTEYQLEIKEIIKGEINDVVIDIDTIGGCDGEEGICMSVSTGYSYELGSQVFIMLKKRPDRDFYQSTNGGLTAYSVNDDGRIYKYREELEIIGGSSFEERNIPDTKALNQIKSIVAEQLK